MKVSNQNRTGIPLTPLTYSTSLISAQSGSLNKSEGYTTQMLYDLNEGDSVFVDAGLIGTYAQGYIVSSDQSRYTSLDKLVQAQTEYTGLERVKSLVIKRNNTFLLLSDIASPKQSVDKSVKQSIDQGECIVHDRLLGSDEVDVVMRSREDSDQLIDDDQLLDDNGAIVDDDLLDYSDKGDDLLDGVDIVMRSMEDSESSTQEIEYDITKIEPEVCKKKKKKRKHRKRRKKHSDKRKKSKVLIVFSLF